MLVIDSRAGSTAAGLNRYNGEGLFGSIGRKLFASGFKKVINAATRAKLPQKIANAVVNGAQSAGQKIGQSAGKKLTQSTAKLIGKKRKKPTSQSSRGVKRRRHSDVSTLSLATPTISNEEVVPVRKKRKRARLVPVVNKIGKTLNLDRLIDSIAGNGDDSTPISLEKRRKLGSGILLE